MTRAFFSVCLAFFAAGFAGGAWGGSPLLQRGDSNIDGAFDLSDARHTLGYLFLGLPKNVSCEDAADANDDGALDLADAVHSLGFLFLGGAPPPAPFAECGRDPSVDALGCADFPACEPEPPAGAARFGEAAVYDGKCLPTAIVVADFDNDHALDLAVTNFCAGVTVALGAGDGTLAQPASYPADFRPQALAVGDLNGDGALDIAAANSDSFPASMVSVLLGGGDGAFGATVNYALNRRGAYSVALGDLDADGSLDMAVGVLGGEVATLLGRGDGTFGDAVGYPASGAGSLALGDVNRDGVVDVAFTATYVGAVSIRLGIGDGTLGEPTGYTAGSRPISVALGDLDRDGALDVAAADSVDNGVTVLLGAGDGSFAGAGTCATGESAQSITLGDVDGDGALDLAVATWRRGPPHDAGSVSLLLGFGDGTFHEAFNYPAGDGPRDLTLGDLNGDGVIDLAVACFKSNEVWIRLGQ